MSDSQRPTGDPSAEARHPTGLRVTLRALWRVLVVGWQFLPFAVAWARDRKRFVVVGRSRSVTSEDRTQRARRLKATFLDLGPAFIKLGQMLSTRPDALPREYIDVLAELQDKVPPDPWADIEPLLERELGGPVAERFDEFDTSPISGASLGQVYEAELDGQRVAVKVLRPDIRERVESDLRVLSTLTPILTYGADPAQAFTLENLTEEFAATIRREMDYAHEARMLREIGESFADTDDVAIPDVVEGHSTDRVVTMSYVDGVKIDDVARLDELGVDRERLVQRLEEVYIRMIVEDGRFHADPHPGNLAVQPDGTLVFYDFGMTGHLGSRTREQLMEFYVGLATDDVNRVMDAFVAMGALDPMADREVMREAFEIVIRQFRGEDISEYRIEQLVGEFESQLYEFPMRLPQDLALVVRVTTVLEGVCRTLDPEFDFIEVITDYVMEQGATGAGGALREEIRETVTQSARSSVTALPRAEAALDTAARDELVLETLLEDSGGLARQMAVRLLLGIVAAAGIPVAAFLFVTTTIEATALAVAVTVLTLGVIGWSFRGQRRAALTTPQFTRHEMRRRREDER
ncbi:ABC1 kinase family protein [Haloarcula nitratireducens]|uniref:AarF/ABC1/UbiB kinase family protein n=1 Tax=Haloarcula nitratireducens TaxID=2487749 RepID=A0AAW4P847_9EURY|nr:AarF/ABC1/UbiB kinase family protein [Halomicroarcula nitratireducens]MBX0293948.1 AarF/ABC1/UbiB kinase family protein [Halomicroarcula nitratireducens]